MCILKAVLQEPPLPSEQLSHKTPSGQGFLTVDILDELIFWACLWETVFIVEEGPNHLVSGTRLLY